MYSLNFFGLPVREANSPLYWHLRAVIGAKYPHKQSIYVAPAAAGVTVKYNSAERLRKDLPPDVNMPFEWTFKWKDTAHLVTVVCNPPLPDIKPTTRPPRVTDQAPTAFEMRRLQQEIITLRENLKSTSAELKQLRDVLGARVLIETFVKQLKRQHPFQRHVQSQGTPDKFKGVKRLLNCACPTCTRTFADLASTIQCAPNTLRMVLTSAYMEFSDVVHRSDYANLRLGEGALGGSAVETALQAIAEYI